jgi:DNA-directed RNA polymerase sigma subunit (sigma70/sigma32)
MIADAPPSNDHVISDQAAEMMELMDMYLDERSAYVIRSRRLQKPMSWPELEAATGMTASQLQRFEKAGMFRLRMMLTKGKELHGTPLGGLG